MDPVNGRTAALVEYLHEEGFDDYLCPSDEEDEALEQGEPEGEGTIAGEGLLAGEEGDEEGGDGDDEEGTLLVVNFLQTFHQLIIAPAIDYSTSY